MKDLMIDIETYSGAELGKTGVYRYAEDPEFEILLFGYSVDGGPVEVIDLAGGEEMPENILLALQEPQVRKWAHNAQFERVCLSGWLGMPAGEYLAPESWYCTMVWAATLGLPLSLESVGTVLGLDKQKLQEGKDLIRFFCCPAKDGKRHTPNDAPEKWQRFIEYNRRDVEAEQGIKEKLAAFPVLSSEWDNYHLDQRINDTGVLIDREFVRQAIRCDDRYKQRHMELARSITGLENPNSAAQLKAWLSDKGVETDSLSKESVTELLTDAAGEVEQALELRQKLSKSSVSKYTAMENVAGADDRARGLLQFYGAGRTGRFAGRLIQVQNLPQNHMADLETARELVRAGDFVKLELLYDSVPKVLSELIRTAFIPRPGHRFFVADFSAVEARCLSFLAGEKWRQQVFADGRDIYCASASQMFGVPVEKHGVNGHLRQKGKIAELALGYGGSVGAMVNMGALSMGLKEEELKPIVDAWRTANPKITEYWRRVDEAVKDCISLDTVESVGDITFRKEKGLLFITLPSGRSLAYVKPRMGTNRFGGESVTYEGTGAQKKWERLESYGPKFVENIIQGYARDLLAEAMQRLTKKGYRIVMHVHDEVVIEAPADASLEEICSVMGETPSWADGLLLRADGYVCDFYRKD